jgi:diaminopimelate epimerase
MTSSTWRALGNTYRVVESPGVRLDAAEIRRLAAETDGVLEVLEERDGRVEIAIWNPDGSQAELSGNGTRIAAAWHAGRSGARVVDVVVGARIVNCRFLTDHEI